MIEMEIQELHTRAMELADQADLQKRLGNADDALHLYEQSLEAERKAAYEAQSNHVGEPTESVLFRSAASLAYSMKDYREAERLICMGLAGNPPAEIAEELRNLYDTVNLEKRIERIAITTPEKERENVTITIPIKERNLLDVIVKKFGWSCVF